MVPMVPIAAASAAGSGSAGLTGSVYTAGSVTTTGSFTTTGSTDTAGSVVTTGSVEIVPTPDSPLPSSVTGGSVVSNGGRTLTSPDASSVTAGVCSAHSPFGQTSGHTSAEQTTLQPSSTSGSQSAYPKV